MLSPEAEQFIKKARAEGHSVAEIKESLLKAGWKLEDIEQKISEPENDALGWGSDKKEAKTPSQNKRKTDTAKYSAWLILLNVAEPFLFYTAVSQVLSFRYSTFLVNVLSPFYFIPGQFVLGLILLIVASATKNLRLRDFAKALVTVSGVIILVGGGICFLLISTLSGV